MKLDWSRNDERPRSIADWFRRQAARHPHQVALRTIAEVVTYAQLDQASDDIASALLDSTSRAAPVALLLSPGSPTTTALLGALKAGRCYVPLDPANPPARNRHIIADAGAGMVLTDGVHREIATELVGDRAVVVTIEQIPSGRAKQANPVPIDLDAHACILYTSGSTGTPKGVLHNQGNLLQYVRNVVNGLKLTPKDRLCHMYGSGVIGASRDTLAAICSGATACPSSPAQLGLDGLADWLIATEVTVWQSVTTVLRHFLWTLQEHRRFPRLRVLRVGGDPLTRQDVALARRHVSGSCAIVVYMGMTEVSPVSQYTIDVGTRPTWDVAPAGHPLEGMEVVIVDPARQPIPQGEVGEIAVRSQFLSPGYWRRQELTDAVFRQPSRRGDPGMYFTGDVGRLNPDGCLQHLGRADAQVKIRGFRVEVTEVEHALRRVTGVAQAAVVPVTESTRGSRLVAYLVPGPGGLPGPLTLRRTLRLDLPSHMVPSRFIQVDFLPLTASGKVDVRELSGTRAGWLEHDGAFIEPRDSTEAQLRTVWEDVLDIQPIGVRDDFFDLGGDSLLAVSLFVRVEATLGARLPLSTLLHASTIERLAEVLRGGDGVDRSSSIVPIQAGGDLPPFFCVHGVGGSVIGYRDLSLALGPRQPFYGLKARGLSDEASPFTRIEAMAAHYVTQIRSVQPKGPYCLGGMSFGGLVAYEMARQLSPHDEVAVLALFDSSVHTARPVDGASARSLDPAEAARPRASSALRGTARQNVA